MVPSKPIDFLAPMITFAVALLLLSLFLELPPFSSSLPTTTPPSSTIPFSPSSFPDRLGSRPKEAFSDPRGAFAKWDAEVGCARFRKRRHRGFAQNASALQDSGGGGECGGIGFGPAHVSVLVKGWTWIPDDLDNLYSCRCGLSCLWTKSPVMADKPDALLFENVVPPARRWKGDPLRVYIDLEASRKPTGFEDIFVGYHANDDVQSTYAGSFFHNNRNYHVSLNKLNDTIVYWSSSRCFPHRNRLAARFLSLLPHHSFGRCLNNVGGLDKALAFYPECFPSASTPQWWDHLHCAMSHYKFVLAIENTVAESYVTEKLYYALDAGAVPIYFGAPNVWDFVPPGSIIDGSKFSSVEELASYVKSVADDPVAYAEFHAWRRCGVLGNYGRTRAVSLDTLPCRLCELVRRMGGRDGRTL